MTRRLWTLLLCSHPEPVLAVTVVATLLSIMAGRGAGTLWVTSAVLSGQLAIGWQNDWIDRGRDSSQSRSDKPLARGAIGPGAVRLASALALVICVPLSFGSSAPSAAVHLIAVAVAMTYNVALKSTWLSAVPFVVSFGLLPAVVTLGLPGEPWPPLWLLAAGATLGAAAHFVQVLPDIPRDREAGIRGLPQRLGQRGSIRAALILMSLCDLAVAIGLGLESWRGWTGLGLGALMVVAVATSSWETNPKLTLRLLMVFAALAVVGLLLAGVGGSDPLSAS